MLTKISESLYVWKETNWNFFAIVLLVLSLLAIGLLIYTFISRNSSLTLKIILFYLSIAFSVSGIFLWLNPPKVMEMTFEPFQKRVQVKDNYSNNPFEFEYADFAFYAIQRERSNTTTSEREKKIVYYYNLILFSQFGGSFKLYNSSQKEKTLEVLSEFQSVLTLPLLDTSDGRRYEFPTNWKHEHNTNFPPKNSLTDFDRISQNANEYNWSTRVHPALVFSAFFVFPILLYLLFFIKGNGLSLGIFLILLVSIVFNLAFGFAIYSRINSQNILQLTKDKIFIKGFSDEINTISKNGMKIKNILFIANPYNESSLTIYPGDSQEKINSLSPKVEKEFLENISGLSNQTRALFLVFFYEFLERGIEELQELFQFHSSGIFLDTENLGIVDRLRLSRIIYRNYN